MAAAASLTIPMTLRTPAQTYDATRIFEATPGLSRLSLDAAAGEATIRFEFPGNLDAVMRKLYKSGLSAAQTVSLSVPVRNLSGRVIDPTALLQHLNASAAVANAGFDGTTVTATIVAATNAMRYIYEEIIIAGLMPLDVPTVAGPSEFVL